MSEYQYFYTSKASDTLSDKDYKKILEEARRYNGARGISGAILLLEGRFFQVLEGPRPAVMILLDKIAKDRRHSKMENLFAEDGVERIFGDYPLAELSLDFKDIGKPYGINKNTIKILETMIDYDEAEVGPILRPSLTAVLEMLEDEHA